MTTKDQELDCYGKNLEQADKENYARMLSREEKLSIIETIWKRWYMADQYAEREYRSYSKFEKVVYWIGAITSSISMAVLLLLFIYIQLFS